ncbi:S41 family peptidase [Hymenobacter sp. UYP22]|uniref:S41 family peptidase n=1 Tax=Hymenobacter sp. UYP22 TaxID=3156348 RepID=UPI0033997938
MHSVPDLRWIRGSRLFTPALRRQLAFIQANRYQDEPYYVGKAPAGNAVFPHEEAYADQRCPDTALRILALCRFWNMVEYFSPYKDLTKPDWTRVLSDLLPLFVAADTPLRYRHAVLVLAGRLQDGHATLAPDPLLEQEMGTYLVPAAVQFIGQQVVVQRVRPDAPSPLKPGDIITHVKGQPVAELVRQRLPETPGSNRAARLRQIAREMLFSPAPELALAIIRDGQPLRVVAPSRLIATLPPVPRAIADSMYRLLTPTIGYIDMAQIRKQKLPRMMQALRQTQGIVVDLRNYPGDFVPHELASYFLAQPTLFAQYSQFDSRFPGRFLTSEPDTLLPRPGAERPYTGQLVVLVNATTLSLGEFTAMALRATPHCTILGSQTAGADGNRTRIVLPGGLVTGMSGLGVFYPNGRPTQGVGIVPDVVLSPTPAGFRDGRDELRERAVELLANRRPTP